MKSRVLRFFGRWLVIFGEEKVGSTFVFRNLGFPIWHRIFLFMTSPEYRIPGAESADFGVCKQVP